MVECKLRANAAMYVNPGQGTIFNENITCSANPSTRIHSVPQDVRIMDALTNPQTTRSPSTHPNHTKTAECINNPHDQPGQRAPHPLHATEQRKHSLPHPTATNALPPATTGGLRFNSNGHQHVFTTSQGSFELGTANMNHDITLQQV